MPRLALLDPTKTGRQAEDLEEKLRRSIVGQEEAIHQVVTAFQTHLAGLAPAGRPVGNFLFLGPTGSGKTHVVEATAECLLKDPRAVIKIDCAEFQHSHEIAKLIGPRDTWDTGKRPPCCRRNRNRNLAIRLGRAAAPIAAIAPCLDWCDQDESVFVA